MVARTHPCPPRLPHVCHSVVSERNQFQCVATHDARKLVSLSSECRARRQTLPPWVQHFEMLPRSLLACNQPANRHNNDIPPPPPPRSCAMHVAVRLSPSRPPRVHSVPTDAGGCLGGDDQFHGLAVRNGGRRLLREDLGRHHRRRVVLVRAPAHRQGRRVFEGFGAASDGLQRQDGQFLSRFQNWASH